MGLASRRLLVLRFLSAARADGKAGSTMKVNIEIDMTPDEARKMMGLPDISGLQKRMLDEMERRMKAAVDTSDPEAMLRAWLPMAAPGFEQFQKFLWDSAKMATGAGDSAKKSGKS